VSDSQGCGSCGRRILDASSNDVDVVNLDYDLKPVSWRADALGAWFSHSIEDLKPQAAAEIET
jgi:hypothetical protein